MIHRPAQVKAVTIKEQNPLTILLIPKQKKKKKRNLG